MAGVGDALTGPSGLEDFLNNPRAAAATLSFGANLLQPPSWGSTPAGQFGQALGGASGAVGNQEAMDIKQQEAQSKEELRAAQAGAAEARVGRAQAGNETALARLALLQNESDRKREAAAQSIRIRAGLGYAAHVQKIQQNNAFLPTSQQKPVPTFDDFLTSMGLSRDALGSAGAAGGQGTGDEELGLPNQAGAAAPSQVPPPERRQVGKSYPTPKGPMTWNGSTWDPPTGR